MIGLLCDGQGMQHRDMFRLTGEPGGAAAVLALAERALGRNPRALVQSADELTLHSNRMAQLLCVAQALAAHALLSEALPERYLVAGYSVGELAAWGVSGLLQPAAAIELAGVRAAIMDRVSGAEDGLAFVHGLRRSQVESLARTALVEIAIVNPGDRCLVGGTRDALRQFCQAALAAGAARAALMPVAVASHTSRLSAAVAPFRAMLSPYRTGRPRDGVVFLSGLDGTALADGASAADALARELDTTLRWDLCLEGAVERGVRVFLELGPGTSLARTARAAYPHIPARSLDEFHTSTGLLAWLAHQSR